ncbi:MAG: ATP-binding protein [Gemmatimonadales bacterium]
MLEPMRHVTRRLFRDAHDAATVQAFWDRAAETLRTWTEAARVVLRYEGPRERGVVTTDGAPAAAPRTLAWSDPEGHRVEVELHGSRADLATDDLESALDAAAALASMVGRRATLERDQRLGNFVVELSRWLLAAPERDLMLRYTLQSMMKLFDAEGAYAALRGPSGDPLRVVVALGRSAEFDGMLLPLDQSTTGRVVRSGEALITGNIREEPDIYLPPTGLGTVSLARAALIAPLQSATGVLGAIGLVRFHRRDAAAPPPPFTIADLHFFTAVAAHLAGGLELSHVVTATRAAADRATAIVNASPLPMVLIDPGGRVHLLNEAGRRVFAVARNEEVVGRPLHDLGVSCADTDLSQLLAVHRRGSPWHGRVVVTHPSGDRRICDCTVTDLEGLGSTDLLVALYDRTDELHAQREMIAREKLATVGEIASGVAHEVNNPLAAIRMEAELLGGKDPETEAAARAIVREVDRAARIVRSLLQLARRADTTPTPVQLNDVIRDVAEIRRRVLRAENVEVQTEIDDAAPAVLGLGQELVQVVSNLVTNAEHAVRGQVSGVIRLSTQGREGWVRFTVEDSGPGVPADVRERIFEPFFSTKSPDEGSGLGLAICRRVVSELGGRIQLEDGELGGARFVVELPAAPVRGGDLLDIR